jgi:hypothetical protein
VLNSYRSGSTTTNYQVDVNGNITELSDGTYTYTYVYDVFNQLKRENNPLLNKSITYEYDLGGNLLAVKEYAYTTGDLVNPTTVTYTYGSAWKDQLTSIGGVWPHLRYQWQPAFLQDKKLQLAGRKAAGPDHGYRCG